jgi:hypothetical protein
LKFEKPLIGAISLTASGSAQAASANDKPTKATNFVNQMQQQ